MRAEMDLEQVKQPMRYEDTQINENILRAVKEIGKYDCRIK
ncbi:MAG: hypothetical protein Q4D94_14855 [Bacillota bacterium]|nr:hypothetical protein [Bacillota bacterium]